MIKTSQEFYRLLLQKFPFDLTQKQDVLLQKLTEFLYQKNNNEIFLLKGYAGTGKTTTISAVVHNLWRTGIKSVLLAPTGRAAKVISVYSKKQAFTIHKKIYFPKTNTSGGIDFVLQPNKHTNTVFMVDEASMIPDNPLSSKLFESGSLLNDLIAYVYSGKNCKLVFIGDTAQLPPVKLAISPALDADKLRLDFDKSVTEIELDEVTRQEQNSGVLANATALRNQLQFGMNNFQFQLNFPDVVKLTDGYDIQNAIQQAYHDGGVEDTAFIVRSNKRANQYNQQIRLKIRGQENRLSVGDYLMVVKNNYFWLKDTSEAGFIANGDICEVTQIKSFKELYDFSFAEVTLRMIDYPNQKPFDTVILLDTLTSQTPSLTYEDSNRLYQAVMGDYAHLKSKYKKFLSVKKNPFFNALQVKFSYAITCHKSQGGQWKTIFIEQPYLRNGVDKEYYRWLYTAVTRTKEKLFLIGFKDDFFKEAT